jgi:hypothetical protein
LIHGLIYCPKYSLELTVKGNGSMVFHGVCRDLVIRRVSGNCILDFEELKVRQLYCRELTGHSVLKMNDPRYVMERNIGEHAVLSLKKASEGGIPGNHKTIMVS